MTRLHVIHAMRCRAMLAAWWALTAVGCAARLCPVGLCPWALPQWVLAAVAACAVRCRALRRGAGRGPPLPSYAWCAVLSTGCSGYRGNKKSHFWGHG
jgi:hypothetical protein